jgi:amidase
MGPHNSPVASISTGEEAVFITRDCYGNQIKNEADLFSSVGWATINPATGPVSIIGAEPGDTLAVHIQEIKVAEQGTMTTVPGMGAVGDLFDHAETKIIKIKDGKALFNDKISIPIKPMIGVIGTAPIEDIPCGTPGRHGGNMDTRFIGQETTLYLPVFVTGGMLAMADLHAIMGDGEVADFGLEIQGQVTVKVDLIKNKQEEWPVLDTGDWWYIIASAKDLDEASDLAVRGLIDFLHPRMSLSINDLVNLLSLTGQMEISQVVDPLKTVRMGIPKSIIAPYGVDF